jgi:2-polyprenyl-6-methoxyphenol hydroxylase-like FAD-dependent oxidoreductase
MAKLDVIVVGVSTGGLAIARGLRAAGIPVRVFERDHKLSDQSQGYKLNKRKSRTKDRPTAAGRPGRDHTDARVDE